MAKPRTYKTEAIVLKRKNFSEADKILTLYSKYHGKISAIAKGVRKLTSRKAGSLELFNHVVIFLAKGKNLDIITEVSLINSFPNFRKDLDKVKLAYEACEVVEKLTVEEKGNAPVFLKFKEFLYGLNCHPGALGLPKGDRIPSGTNHQSWGRFYRSSRVRLGTRSRMTMLDFKKSLLSLLGFGIPKNPTNENIDNYIESIIERKLVVRRLF